MGVQFQEYEAERTLLTITQKERESITEYYHRISALWNLAHTSERARVRKFLTSIRPVISMSLLDREFTDVSSALESARIVEERRKDLDNNYPRRNRTLNQSSSSNSQSKNVSVSQSRSTGSHPNDRFGAVAKKPNGWVGAWFDPEDHPRKLTEELRKELSKQGRCWSCRGSGHRGPDSVCPRSKKVSELSDKGILSLSDSESESEKA
jgi:hypothetical protein